jgi:hypothetical protein
MSEQSQSPPNRIPLLILAWLWVVLPFGYGVYELIRKVTQLFS